MQITTFERLLFLLRYSLFSMVNQVEMEDSERDKILASVYELRDWELEPVSFEDPFSDMNGKIAGVNNTDEKSKFLVEFMNQNNTLKEFVEIMKAERASSLDYKSKFEEEHKQNLILQERKDNLLATIESLRDQLALMNQHKYGSKSKRERRSDQRQTL